MRTFTKNKCLERTAILCCFLSLTILTKAQKITVDLQPVYELKESNGFISSKVNNLVKVADGYLSYDIGGNRKGILSSFKFSKMTYSITLIKFDNAMNVVKTNDLAGINFGPFSAFIKEMNKQVYLCYYEHVGTEEAVNVKAAIIDLATLQIGEPKQLFKFNLKDVGMMKVMEILNKNELTVSTSPDRSKILFFRRSNYYNDLSFCVTDKDLHVLYSKDKLIENDADIVIRSACVDNAGNVYTGYKVESHKNGIRGHVIISQNSGQEKDLLISEADELYDVLVVAAKDGSSVHVAGNCFADKFIGAVYSAEININKQELTGYKRTDLSEELVAGFDQHGLARTGGKKFGLYPFHMQAYELEDGSLDIFGGVSRYKTNDNASGRQTSTEYYTGSMLNVRFKNGTTVFSRIPLNRDDESDEGDGYYVLPYKNDIIVLYNDHEDNLAKNITEMPSNSDNNRNSVMAAATIKANGDIKREVIINLKDDNFIALPGLVQKFSSSELLIPIRKVLRSGLGGKEFRRGFLSVDQ